MSNQITKEILAAEVEMRGEKASLSKVFMGLAASGVLASALVAGAPVQAADWSSTNVQLLYGNNYADDFGIDDKAKWVMTIEHADGWKYGDNYLFVDISNPFADGTTSYGEFSPRISPAKIFGAAPVSFGIVKDVMVAGTLEMGEGVHSYLIGVGLPLDLPGFAFADLNIYARKSYRDFATAGQTDWGGQATIDWLLPFKIGGTKWSFGGFLDYAFAEKGGVSPKEDNIISSPQLLFDLGDALGGAPGVLEIGIEYDFWWNKYGIDGVNENNPLAMVKWTF